MVRHILGISGGKDSAALFMSNPSVIFRRPFHKIPITCRKSSPLHNFLQPPVFQSNKHIQVSLFYVPSSLLLSPFFRKLQSYQGSACRTKQNQPLAGRTGRQTGEHYLTLVSEQSATIVASTYRNRQSARRGCKNLNLLNERIKPCIK